MKFSPFWIMLLFCISTECFSQTPCSFNYRKRITFNPAAVSGTTNLVDFPVIIKITGDNNLKTTANSGHVSSSSGFDIFFTSDDGVTVLNHQLVSYSGTSGNLECWVKIPVLSASINTYIYMYYGSTTATVDPSSSSTWSNGYVGVWHFDNSLNNSTSTTGLNGTNNSTSNSTVALFGGNARTFSSSASQYVDVTPYNSAYDLTTDITVSAWINLASLSADQKIAGNQNNSAGGWKFGVFSDNKIEFEIRNSSNNSFLSRSASGGSTLTSSTWYYAVGEFSDVNDFINTYLNGVLDRNYSTTGTCGTSNGTMKMGREPFSSSAFFNGNMDELRVSNVVRSADWIATEYANQSSPGPGTFYSISAEPKIWTGGTNSNYNSASNWVSNSSPSTNDDVIINNGTNQPILQAAEQVNSLWIKAGATLSLAANQLSFRSDITNCGTLTGATGELRSNSTNSYNQNQYLSGTGTYNLNNLTVNNTFGTSPTLILRKDVNVAGTLTLTSGIVYTSTTNILALGNSATSTSGSASSFVSGPISKSGTANFVFPIGKGSSWRRASVTGISSSSVFRGEYFNTAYTSTVPANSPLNHVSSLEYWQIDRLSGSGNATLSLYWESASMSGITTCTDLTIARWNGSSWDERPGTTAGGSSCSGSGTGTVVTNAIITAFSPFTFGSKSSGAINPLPVQITGFNSECANTNVLLNWSTSSESNNSYFKIEESDDGTSWKELTRVKGAGNSSVPQQYSYSDRPSTSAIVYYRLSQVDYDGKTEIFGTVASDCNKGVENLLLYPNPTSGEVRVDLTLSRTYGKGEIKIINGLGQVCQEQSINLTRGKTTQTINLKVTPGVYSLLLVSPQLVLPARQLIVK